MGWLSSPRRAPRAQPASRRCVMSRIERHTVFREMAKRQLSRGETSKRRHWQLLDYADRLGIGSAEAVELIDEARRAVGLPSAPAAWEREAAPWREHVRTDPLWLTIAIIVLAVVIINLLLIRVL